jgi:hypothetical protein
MYVVYSVSLLSMIQSLAFKLRTLLSHYVSSKQAPSMSSSKGSRETEKQVYSEILCGWQFQAIQIVFGTLPLLGALIYFLFEASDRSSEPIYNLKLGTDDDAIDEAIDETGRIIPLASIVNTFLIVFGISTCMAVYMSVYVPFHRKLIEDYLNGGERVTGDVYYKQKRICAPKQNGFAVYPHPSGKTYPLSIRKNILVHERYTRERVIILLLPNQPFSGQSKSDLTCELTRIQRNSKKNAFLAVFYWVWAVFTLASPVYVLFAMGDLVKDSDYYINDFAEDSTRAWTVYAFCAGLIPVFACLVTGVIWKAHHYRFVRGDAKFLAEGESRTGAKWYEDNSDDEEVAYKPPSTVEGSDSLKKQKTSTNAQ